MSSRIKARSAVLSLCTLAVVATGAWFGADLKTQREAKKVRQRPSVGNAVPAITLGSSTRFSCADIAQEHATIREATSAEKIAILESTKSGLVTQKAGLEKKIGELKARQAETEARKEEAMEKGKG